MTLQGPGAFVDSREATGVDWLGANDVARSLAAGESSVLVGDGVDRLHDKHLLLVG